MDVEEINLSLFRLIANGQANGSPPKRSGSWLAVQAKRTDTFPGATSGPPTTSITATFGLVISRRPTMVMTGTLGRRRSTPSQPPAGTAYTTWWETSGSGPLTGGPSGTMLSSCTRTPRVPKQAKTRSRKAGVSCVTRATATGTGVEPGARTPLSPLPTTWGSGVQRMPTACRNISSTVKSLNCESANTCLQIVPIFTAAAQKKIVFIIESFKSIFVTTYTYLSSIVELLLFDQNMHNLTALLFLDFYFLTRDKYSMYTNIVF